jgi:crossover junction endodeoxyribonuclease RuvC
MLAIGIDPGTATTGYGLVRRNESGDLVAVDWGVILTSSDENPSNRLVQIHKALKKILKKHNPECAAVESLFFQRNVRTAMSVGQARGVVLLTLEQAGIPSYDYNPNQVKQAVSGYGAADKKQMQAMVRTLLNLPDLPKPDDAADALAVAICHLNTQRTQQMIEHSS